MTDVVLPVLNEAEALPWVLDRMPPGFDPIVVDCTLWQWANRDDQPPPGLREAGQRDLERVLTRLESELAARAKPWPFGAPGVVECAWFANLTRSVCRSQLLE